MRHGVVDELPEVPPDRRLAAADVDVEHLHALELVDHRHALRRGQLARIAPARARQAVDAGQVAGVGQLPGQADRRVQTSLELIDEPRRSRAHHASLEVIMPVSASASSAFS